MRKLELIVVLVLLIAGCNHTQPSDDTYMVIESHASWLDFTKDKLGQYQSATYEIKHRNVVTHAKCYVLIREREGRFDRCQDFPDPPVPVGVPLRMNRSADNTLNWLDTNGDGVSFKILSEKAIKLE